MNVFAAPANSRAAFTAPQFKCAKRVAKICFAVKLVKLEPALCARLYVVDQAALTHFAPCFVAIGADQRPAVVKLAQPRSIAWNTLAVAAATIKVGFTVTTDILAVDEASAKPRAACHALTLDADGKNVSVIFLIPARDTGKGPAGIARRDGAGQVLAQFQLFALLLAQFTDRRGLHLSGTER